MDLAYFKPKFFKPVRQKTMMAGDHRRKGVSLDRSSQTSLVKKFDAKAYEKSIRPKSAYSITKGKINHLINLYSKEIDKHIFGEIPEFYSVDSNIREKYEVINQMEISKYTGEINEINSKLKRDKMNEIMKFKG